ncbi:hypothetical protein TWF481_011473 [Arthrobotrys musiformis]|uniref:tyrosinase n=1 Tax=Arthrobotrys musiformis TaxID=47236 RepID=A0AAV9W0J7_9PEZI
MTGPTWKKNILPELFQYPDWIKDKDEAERKAAGWVKAMKEYQIDLSNYESVCEWSETIYYHLASGNMPPSQPFPDEACEKFRLWINQGLRKKSCDPIEPRKIQIPNTRLDPDRCMPRLTARKDILSLSQEELDHYRMQLDDVLKAQQVKDGDDISPWQKIGYLHSNWCLHYQQAFLPWHRANLLYVEKLIGCRIPYWNWYAKSTDSGSPEFGIPKAFLEDEYIHPKSGERRKNPLKFACAKDGQSKTTKSLQEPTEHIRRFPWIDNPLLPEYEGWMKHMSLFHEQTKNALDRCTFSVPQQRSKPWANIPAFNIPVGDDEYKRSRESDYTFDNLFEQAHDNYHGFVGPDMSDNAFTAFDPIFYSLHSNIDRIFDMYLTARPPTEFSSNFPLEPFKGPLASTITEGNPLKYIYTTLGDMVKPTRALGYFYEGPQHQDYYKPSSVSKFKTGKLGNNAYATTDTWEAASSMVGSDKYDKIRALVEFDGVRCTDASYTIDVFISDSEGFTPPTGQIDVGQKEYVGRMTRITMGEGTDKGRCVKQGIRRVIFVAPEKLDGFQKDKVRAYQVVKDMDENTVVPEEVYSKLPGFVGKLVWGVQQEDIVLPPAAAKEPTKE